MKLPILNHLFLKRMSINCKQIIYPLLSKYSIGATFSEIYLLLNQRRFYLFNDFIKNPKITDGVFELLPSGGCCKSNTLLSQHTYCIQLRTPYIVNEKNIFFFIYCWDSSSHVQRHDIRNDSYNYLHKHTPTKLHRY